MRRGFMAGPFTPANILLLAFSQIARGCECAPPPPPCEAVGGSDLVFLGTVLNVTGSGFKTAKMRVDKAYKGAIPKEVELYDDGMCDGPNLKVAGQYLMYTSGAPTEPLPARGCTRSRAIEYADEDLQFLKAYAAGKTVTEISGTVRLLPDQPKAGPIREEDGTPMKDVAITISGARRSFPTKTDASGHYSVSGLPPGDYQISAELAGYRSKWGFPEIQLAPKACAVEDMLMNVDRRVEGTVRTEDGHPAEGARVEMVPTKPSSKPWENPILLTDSDENGFYSIDGIPPGDYYLGINIHTTPTNKYPYPPTYYPNAPDVSSALPVAFLTGASVRSYDLTLPPKLKVVRVRGRITDASGRAPRDFPQVRIRAPGGLFDLEGQPPAVDAEGRFEIDLCEGVRYSGWAFAGPPMNSIFSAVIEFTASDAELHFVVDKTAKEFNQILREELREFERN